MLRTERGWKRGLGMLGGGRRLLTHSLTLRGYSWQDLCLTYIAQVWKAVDQGKQTRYLQMAG
jgi:hypothetical protein